MKIDIYTKSILTIIALNLTLLSFCQLDIIPAANANNSASRPTEKSYGLVPLNKDGSVNVKLTNSDEMDVNITGIETWDNLNVNLDEIETSDNINVNIEEIDNTNLYSSELPVTIENQPVKISKDF